MSVLCSPPVLLVMIGVKVAVHRLQAVSSVVASPTQFDYTVLSWTVLEGQTLSVWCFDVQVYCGYRSETFGLCTALSGAGCGFIMAS